MNPLSLIGAFVITLALLSYGIGSISVQHFKLVSRGVLFFLTFGVLLDLTAIGFMISGSDKGVFSLHGILGFTASVTIVVDTALIWRSYLQNGIDSVINKSVLLFSKIAYAWWLIVYFTGSLLIIWPN